MKFATKLKKLIEARGWNKSHVAKGMRVSGSTLTRWTREEPGKGKKSPTKPKLEQLLPLARLMGVPMEYLADDAMGEADLVVIEQERKILEMARRIGLEEAYDRLVMRSGRPVPGPMLDVGVVFVDPKTGASLHRDGWPGRGEEKTG